MALVQVLAVCDCICDIEHSQAVTRLFNYLRLLASTLLSIWRSVRQPMISKACLEGTHVDLHFLNLKGSVV